MLLIDEIDKVDIEIEGLLLEVLFDFVVIVFELGILIVIWVLFVLLIFNVICELFEVFKCCCLYLYIDFLIFELECCILLF